MPVPSLYIRLWLIPALLIMIIVMQWHSYNNSSIPSKREDEYMLLQRHDTPKLIEAIKQNPLKRWYPGALKRILDQLYGYEWSLIQKQKTYARTTELHTLFTEETKNHPTDLAQPIEGFLSIQLHLNQAEHPHQVYIATPSNKIQSPTLLELRYDKNHYTITPVQ